MPGLDRKGLLIAASAFVLWGLMPLYWHLLKAVPSLQIVAHRVLWCAVLVALWLLWSQGRGWFRAILAQPRLAAMLTLSGLCIGVNWGLYIWAVNAGHVVESSLGYFINPLLNVVIGTLFLRERLNPTQWVSVAITAAGVLWLTFNYGSFPWIALLLAASFGFYGFIRKLAVVDSIPGVLCSELGNSGWPGVMEWCWRKRLSSSMGRSKPARLSQLYRNMDPCPAERMNRSRFTHVGSLGL